MNLLPPCENLHWRKFSLLRERIENLWWEFLLGIATRGVENVDASTEERIHYGTVSYATTYNILNSLNLSSSDVFVDLGCGKGRVICCASRYKVEEVIGVECEAKLSEDARRNVIRLRGKQSPVIVVTMPAEEFDNNRGTVYYMFHPFGPETLKLVLARLRASLYINKREVRIVYVNAVHGSVLKACPWLQQYDLWMSGDRRSTEHTISFWRSSV